MTALISIIIILACVLLVAVVFVQNPKGGGLTNDFGTQQLGGVQRANDFIEKATWGLSIAIVVLSLALTHLIQPIKVQAAPTDAGQEQQGGKPGDKGQQQQQPQPAPVK